jgi:hypothetical protein
MVEFQQQGRRAAQKPTFFGAPQIDAMTAAPRPFEGVATDSGVAASRRRGTGLIPLAPPDPDKRRRDPSGRWRRRPDVVKIGHSQRLEDGAPLEDRCARA